MLLLNFNHNFQILETEGYVAVVVEIAETVEHQEIVDVPAVVTGEADHAGALARGKASVGDHQ